MAELDARETLFLELINRARLDPLAEAARYNLSDLNLGTSGITAAPKQILADNSLLNDSAQGHANWIIDTDTFSHTGAGGSSPTQRMQNAGFALNGSWQTAENISWSGTTGLIDANAAVLKQHEGLFLSAGHRHNILNGELREIGVGTSIGAFVQNGTSFDSMASAFNFAASGAAHFVGGVTYNDSNNDHFYSIGEGRGGITAQLMSGASVLASTASQSAGAFALATTASGTLEVVFSGGGTATTGAMFTAGNDNLKFDFVDSNTIATNVSATLTRSGVGLELIGIENVNATGNSLGNALTGNRGDNIMNGAAGSDTIDGGAGTDTVVLNGAASSYSISKTAAGGFALKAADGSVDTVLNVERFQFDNGTLTAAQLPIGTVPAPTPDPTPTPPPNPTPDPTPTPPPDVPPTQGAVLNSVRGGGADDVLRGTTGNDLIRGFAGADRISGAAGDDVLSGGSGNDSLRGQDGHDRLNGGLGHDVLAGGAGRDWFDFTTVLSAKNADTMLGFNTAEDMIALKKTVYTAVGAALTASEFHIGSGAHDGSDRVIYNSATGSLSYDADGTGALAAVRFATLDKGLALSFADFVII
jgi:Ca2+-binding RTX toxin-like protein